MAKKNLAGQINMFDVFRDLEKNAETSGKVEMVSLMPESELAAEGETENEDEETPHEKHEVGLEIADKKAQHGKNDKELKSEKKIAPRLKMFPMSPCIEKSVTQTAI